MSGLLSSLSAVADRVVDAVKKIICGRISFLRVNRVHVRLASTRFNSHRYLERCEGGAGGRVRDISLRRRGGVNARARHGGDEQILSRPAFADACGDSRSDPGEVEVVEGCVNVEDAAREGFTHRVFRRGIVCGQQGKGGGGEGR